MSKQLDTSPISTTAGFPIGGGTLAFLQQAYNDQFAALVISKIGVSYSTSKTYILYGCVASVVGPNTNFTAGAVFFNGEVFISPAQSITTPTGPNVIIANVLVTQGAPDPVPFFDGSSHSVHNIRNCSFAAGLTGTGTIANFSAFVGLETIAQRISAAPDGQTLTFTQNKDIYFSVQTVNGVNTIALDSTGYREGVELTLYLFQGTSTAPSIAFTYGAFEVAILLTSSIPLNSSKPTIIKIKIVTLPGGGGANYNIEAYLGTSI